MKLFLRSVLYFGFYWVEKFDALKKDQREAAVAQIRRTKYPTCLKTVRREQIVRLFAQTSLHTVVSARRTSSTHKSMEMYVGVEQATFYPCTFFRQRPRLPEGSLKCRWPAADCAVYYIAGGVMGGNLQCLRFALSWR